MIFHSYVSLPEGTFLGEVTCMVLAGSRIEAWVTNGSFNLLGHLDILDGIYINWYPDGL